MNRCFNSLFSLRTCLLAALRPMAALVAGSLFLLAGCGDKHEPTKPTVAADAAALVVVAINPLAAAS